MSEDKKDLFLYYWKLITTYKEPEKEFNFDASIGRKHHFDLCWPERKIAVEINGQAWHTKGGGRHGKDADLEKMNLAVVMGWRVFQLSPEMLNNDPDRWINMILNQLRGNDDTY